MAGAHVVCRELGFGPAIADPFEWQKSQATGSFPVNINATVPHGKNINYYCHGSEKFLHQCGRSVALGSVNCEPHLFLGVACSRAPASQKCVSTCDLLNGFTVPVSAPHTCVRCAVSHGVCKRCSRRDPSICEECYGGRFFSYFAGCVLKCDPKYEFGNTVTGRCELCNSKCAGCYDSTRDDNCIRCAKGFVLDGTRCVSTCPSGQLAMHMEVCTAVSAVACDASETCDEQAGCFNTSSVAGIKSACWPCPAGSAGNGKECKVYSARGHKLVAMPRNQTALVGQSVVVELVCRANMTTTTYWFHEGRRLQLRPQVLTEKHQLFQKSHYVMGTNGSLFLTRITLSMGGTYTCVSQTTQLQLSVSAYVTVLDPYALKIASTRPAGDVSLAEMQPISLTCTMEHFTFVDIFWRYPATVYDASRRVMTERAKSLTSSLTIHHAVAADSGVYICVIKNSTQQTEHRFSVTVRQITCNNMEAHLSRVVSRDIQSTPDIANTIV
ncbi:uncharacterized protein LOC135824319 [Sycon ciliatum]|uniref:uncharacterized protein LOC135824319 n=1 Tax=Sycon ciliatum TaxID=27933 RepID=UPI0031F5FF61